MSVDRRRILAAGLSLAAVLATRASESAGPVAETSSGRVRGRIDRGAVNFRGIPYAADTSGKNRFRAPQPMTPWSGIREATAFGNRAPQSSGSRHERPRVKPLYNVWTSFEASEPMSENCLNLNIWTPGLSGKRPVMVWLHPGGFHTGAGAEPPTNGAALALTGDVVVVSLNHRLTSLGYSYLAHWGDEFATEHVNPGQRDIIAALQWVQTNIARFGGDAGNVTLFGQSGGGAKICSLLATPSARGLFHKAICQSGSYVELTPKALADRAATDLARRCGVGAANIESLRAIPAKTWVDLANETMSGELGRGFDPVLDGKLLPFDPFSPAALAVSAGIPLMIGSTATEATSLNHDADSFGLTWDSLPAKWMQPYTASQGEFTPSKEDAMRQIAGFRERYPAESPSDLYFRYSSDIWTILNAITIADRQSAASQAPVFMYEVGYRTPVDGGRWGSPHSLDVPLIFRTIGDASSIVSDNADAHAVSNQMSAAWAAFAHGGDPNHAGLPHWPRFTQATRQAMVFDVRSSVVDNYRGADREVLRGVPTLRV